MTQRPPQSSAVSSPFFFVGEALALDLVNTEIVARGKPQDLLASPADLAHWWEAARARYPEPGLVSANTAGSVGDTASLDAVRRLRAMLRRLFTAVADGRPVDEADLATLNTVLQGGFPSVAMMPDGDFVATYGVRDDGAAGLLPVALSASHLLTAADHHRLHKCANERCVLMFYDTTKSGTRRWHSPDCMNRARSAEHYRRGRQAQTQPEPA